MERLIVRKMLPNGNVLIDHYKDKVWMATYDGYSDRKTGYRLYPSKGYCHFSVRLAGQLVDERALTYDLRDRTPAPAAREEKAEKKVERLLPRMEGKQLSFFDRKYI